MREYGVIGGIKTYQVQTAVLGTGAAGYNAACLLKKGGADDLVIITESRNAGTSRNTGSDKQTYYKLSLAGDDPDSVFSLASDLFAGRAVDEISHYVKLRCHQHHFCVLLIWEFHFL